MCEEEEDGEGTREEAEAQYGFKLDQFGEHWCARNLNEAATLPSVSASGRAWFELKKAGAGDETFYTFH